MGGRTAAILAAVLPPTLEIDVSFIGFDAGKKPSNTHGLCNSVSFLDDLVSGLGTGAKYEGIYL